MATPRLPARARHRHPQARDPDAVGVILGGHGITAWGDSSDEAEANSLWVIAQAQVYIDAQGVAEPFGPAVPDRTPLAPTERQRLAAALLPHLRAVASSDRPMIGHFCEDEVVLEFLAGEKLARLAGLGTSCPDHFLRTKIRPLVVDVPPTSSLDAYAARLQTLHQEYRASYEAYYRRHADETSPAMRGADPTVILVPGVGLFAFGKDKQTARVSAEFYVNAINVMRGAESISTYAPIDESEKFRVEYWELEEAKLRRLPPPRSHDGRVALVTGAASGIGKAIATALAARGACVVVADLDLERARRVAADIGSDDVALGVAADVSREPDAAAAVDAAVLAFGGIHLLVNCAGLSVSKPLLETTEADWDIQHDVMAKGSFLMSKAAAGAMIDQGLGGDIVYICSKNAVFAGPNNIAYSAAKADQAHQVRLLAAELGERGIRVNGVNPDGVVQGSGIFAGGWGADRAAVYGVPEVELGSFYARRTLLKREVLPEHVAEVVTALTSAQFGHTTGTIIPVDSGVAAAFLR